MIENVTNIGQLLIPANQAVQGRSEVSGSKKFSLSEEQTLQDKNTSEITSDENIDKENKYKDVENDKKNITNKENEVEIKSNNKPSKKVEDNNNKKLEPENANNTENNIENESNENEPVVSAIESVINESIQNELPEQNQVANEEAIPVSEEPNTVTGHAVKSEQIKTLHETEKGQLGIKTILPENSHGENGLKEVPSPVENIQPDQVPGKDNNPDQGTEIIPDNKTVQVSTETITDKNNNNSEEILNMVQNDKNTISETASNSNNKNDELFVESKPVQKITNVINKYTQDISDSNKNVHEQKADLQNEVLQAAVEGEDLLNNSEGNAQDTLKGKTEISDVLASDIKTTDDAIQLLDDNKVVVEQSFANTQANVTELNSTTFSEKANIDIKGNSEADVSTQISKHISESIQGSTIAQGGEKQITVYLNPPELGSVMIKFTEKNSEIMGTLEVSKSQTKAEIEHALPDILRSLSESGIQLKKVEVVSTENRFSNTDSQKEQFMQNENSGNSGYNHPGNQNAGSGNYNNAGFQQWFSSSIEYSRGYSSQNLYAGSGSINMLA